MKITIGLLLAVALLAICSGLAGAEVIVRMRSTPGGPQIHVGDTPVVPRWFFGSPRGGTVRASGDWAERSFEFTVPRPVDGTGTLHFRFGHEAGEVWLADVRVVDTQSGEDVLPPGSFASEDAFADTWNVWPPGDANTVGETEARDGALHVVLTEPATGRWPDFHLHINTALSFAAGRTYRCSFRVRAVPARAIHPALYRVEGGVWTQIGGPPGPFLHQVRLAADAGVRFVSFSAPNCWDEPGAESDFTPIDDLCEEIISVHPEALLVPRVSANAPAWWLEAHPEGRMIYEDESPGRMASVSSREYRADAAAHLERLCRHLTRRFPEHFAGIHPCGQNTGEWFYEGSWDAPVSGYDPATLQAWRQWLARRGFDSAQSARVPTPEERRAAPFGLLRDPARERMLIEFNRFLQHEMADTVLELASAARCGTGGRKLVVFFYGYHYEFGALPNGAPISGHYALADVLESDDIDILCSPISYGDRQWPGTAPCMSPAESIRDAGIMWLNEDDTRTYLSGTTDYGGVEDLQQTRDVMLRNTAQAALRGFATWWMDLPGLGWFADPAIWDELQRLRPVDEALLARERPFTPGIAAIVGEDSMCHLAAGGNAVSSPLIYQARAALGRCGAPYGQYMLRDAIRGTVPATLQIYLAAWRIGQQARERLAANRPPGVTRVWCYAPGWLTEEGGSLETMRALTGFDCRQVSPDTARVTPTPAGEAVGLDEPWGPEGRIDPLFTVDAGPEGTLATWEDGSPAVALRRSAEGLDVFVGVPQLTPELIRALARLAGVHLFADVDVSVWAAEPYLSIHAMGNGPLSLDTGRAGPVVDALDGTPLGRGPELTLQMRRGETRVLRY
ncbi:MAG: hypothetical protein U9R79_09660 [Armatimonadota bacterium]|nr:hypothetical protein [Armatimonadota bacterium]